MLERCGQPQVVCSKSAKLLLQNLLNRDVSPRLVGTGDTVELGGKTLASLVLRADDEWSRLPVVGPPLSQLPPEPLRWPLMQAVVWAIDSGDRAEEQGRRRGVLRGLVASSVTA